MRLLELIPAIAQILPPWALAVLGAALAVVAIPAWLRFVRSKQIRGQVRAAFYARDAGARDPHVERAFAIAGGRPPLLLVIAETATKMHLPAVRRRALAALEHAGALVEDVRRLREVERREEKRGGHPIEEAVIVERMWREGMKDAARTRLSEARARFPDDAELGRLAVMLRPAADDRESTG